MKVTILQPNAKPKVKKRVCAYARVSTDSSSQGESLENQISYYERLIRSNSEYEYIGIFADRGYTGTKEGRPEFQKMLASCREGKIDLIYTKSISRFARNTTIVLQYIRELKDLGVEVEFQEEKIKTLSKDGELMLAVLSSFAEEESRSMSENVRWSIEKKFERGELIISTKRFLGYDKDEYGDLVINEKEANIVRFIFDEYVSGKGVERIAKELNSKKICSVSGGKWHSSSILYILKNEKYIGDAILQKYFTEDHLSKKKIRNTGERCSFYVRENHSPIITREQWEKAQEEIKKRAKSHGQGKKHALSGLLKCSKCGAALQRRVWNSGQSCEKVVWQCSNYIKNGKNACSGTDVYEALLEPLNIKEETIVKEWIVDGKKYYTYTSAN